MRALENKVFSAHVSQATIPRTPHKRLPSLETTLFQPSQHYISVKSSLHHPNVNQPYTKTHQTTLLFLSKWGGGGGGAVFYQGFLFTHMASIQNICSKCLRNHTTWVYNTNTHFTIVEMDSKEKVQMFMKLQWGTTQTHNSHAGNLLQADRFYKCFKQSWFWGWPFWKLLIKHCWILTGQKCTYKDEQLY